MDSTEKRGRHSTTADSDFRECNLVCSVSVFVQALHIICRSVHHDKGAEAFFNFRIGSMLGSRSATLDLHINILLQRDLK